MITVVNLKELEMGTTYSVNKFREVVPCYDGRVSNSTRDRRELTEFEEQLLEEIEGLKTELTKAIPLDEPVKVNFADTQKEFEEKFCYSFMENGEKRINNIMWKSCDNANDVWEWFEQKLKEAGKISA